MKQATPRPRAQRRLSPGEVPAAAREYLYFDRQFVPDEGPRTLRIWRKCKNCGREFHSKVTTIRADAKRGRLLTSLCRPCCLLPGAHQRGWRGRLKTGKTRTVQGYVLVWAPDEPVTQKGYVLEHRLVMSRHLGRPLLPAESVHHKNGKRDDNRLENLELWTVGHKEPPGVRVADCLVDRFATQPEIIAMEPKQRAQAIAALRRVIQAK